MALPAGIGRLAVRVARLVPDAVLRAVLPARFAFGDVAAASLTLPETPVRLFIGPVNFAGQGFAWARAAERLPGVGATSMAYHANTGYGFDVDQRVPAAVYLLSRTWARRQRETILANATHVIIEANRHILGDVYGASVLDEVRALHAAGVRVALLSHGSDARSPERHRAEVVDSPYADPRWELIDALTAESAAHRELMATAGVPTFVSTPGLLADVPDAQWLPVVVEPARWESQTAVLADEVPLVVHAPSNPIVKGTDLIEPVLARLAAEGLIRYERISGVLSADMPAAFARADIVLDQFRLGDYGVAACEALAAGRVVIGNVTPAVRDHVRSATGRDLPIVQADIAGLEGVIRGLIADRDGTRKIAAVGPEFVRAVHDGARSAEVLRPFLTAGT